eukprot:6848883-Pyramimonas_sp.AAC.1
MLVGPRCSQLRRAGSSTSLPTVTKVDGLPPASSAFAIRVLDAYKSIPVTSNTVAPPSTIEVTRRASLS